MNKPLEPATSSGRAGPDDVPLEEIDLAVLTADLQTKLGRRTQTSRMRGKTLLRDAVMAVLGCSALRAEQLVDLLVARGFARFQPDAAVGSHEVLGYWELSR